MSQTSQLSIRAKEIKSKLSAYIFNWKIKIFLSVLNPSCYSLPLQVNCNKRDLKCFFLSQRILAQQSTKHSFINSQSENEILCFGVVFFVVVVFAILWETTKHLYCLYINNLILTIAIGDLSVFFLFVNKMYFHVSCLNILLLLFFLL